MVPQMGVKASEDEMGMRKWVTHIGALSRSRPRDCQRRARVITPLGNREGHAAF